MTHQSARDRPDLIARVFQLKLKELIKDIEHNQVLGFQVARIYVIEFQKRGLPHAHVLIWIRKDDIPTIEEQMNTTICAEIPNPLLYPKLYRTVMKHMIHGPCGKQNQSSPCMEGEECTKEFPKDFADETILNVVGYPTYRRRQTGSYLHKKKSAKHPIEVDNRWVVPHNPYLLLKYDCHINLEYCSSILSVKYVFKYVCKGHDCASIKVHSEDVSKAINWDEV